MPSQPQSSSDNEALVRDKKTKQQAASSFTTGADAMTVEEREDEREAITHARPGGFERVVNEQRLPAEGIGAADGEIRHAFTDIPDQDSPVRRDEAPATRDAGRGTRDAERPEEIRC